MQAAEKKLVIEKGADFYLKIAVTEGIGTQKDLTGASVVMRIMKHNKEDGNIYYIQPNGELTTTKYEFAGTVNDAPNGECSVLIDKDITSKFDTGVSSSDNVFMTEYNYFYTIDIVGAPNGEDMRILRGRCAVRV